MRRACLLIDARRGFMGSDKAVMAALDETAVSYLVVLTKADKLKAEPLKKLLRDLEDTLSSHTAAYPHTLATSARTDQGIAKLRAHLAAVAGTGGNH